MQRVDPLGVRLEVEPVHLDHVPFVLHSGIAERNLIVERFRPDELHWFEVRVERVHHGQRNIEDVFDDESHRHVIREANLIAYGHKLAAARNRQHSERQRPAYAEPGSTGGEPKGYLLVRLVGRFGIV